MTSTITITVLSPVDPEDRDVILTELRQYAERYDITVTRSGLSETYTNSRTMERPYSVWIETSESDPDRDYNCMTECVSTIMAVYALTAIGAVHA